MALFFFKWSVCCDGELAHKRLLYHDVICTLKFPSAHILLVSDWWILSQISLQCYVVASESFNDHCPNLMLRTDWAYIDWWLFTWSFTSPEDLTLEKPLEAAMLVSLTGTRCIMSNQWYCTLAENTDKLNLTMNGEHLHWAVLQSASFVQFLSTDWFVVRWQCVVDQMLKFNF